MKKGKSWKTQNLNGIDFLNINFITVGDESTYLSSSDGINWLQTTLGGIFPLNGINYAKDKFILVSGDWDNEYGIIFTSKDGKTWENKKESN